jgi:hypothetical protein
MWLLLLACSTDAPSELRCEDLSDPAAFILEAWAGDQDAAIEIARACTDEETRLVMIESIAKAHPGQSMALCEVLGEGAARERCIRRNSRPHLWESPPPITESAGRPGGGPGSLHPDPGVESGLSLEAASLCRAQVPRSWADECFFEAAEARLESEIGSLDQRYAEASALCLEAGGYRTFCLGHLHLQMARAAPPADGIKAPSWEMYRARAERIDRIWRERGAPEYGALARAHFWSEVLWESVNRARLVVGNAAEHVPADALPHLHAAASYRLLADRALHGQSLEEAVASVQRALEERSTDPAVVASSPPIRAEQNLWPEDRSDDAQIPALIYLGISRRAVDSDPQVDIAICLLEAAARLVPRRQSLIDQGGLHAHPLVRWTAERLGPQ